MSGMPAMPEMNDRHVPSFADTLDDPLLIDEDFDDEIEDEDEENIEFFGDDDEEEDDE